MWYLHRAEIIFLRIFLKIICSSPNSGYWSCLLQCTSYGRWTTLLSIILISKIKNTVLLVTALIFTSWVGKTITFYSDVNALRISRDVYYLYKYWSRERKEAFWSILLWRQDMDRRYSPEYKSLIGAKYYKSLIGAQLNVQTSLPLNSRQPVISFQRWQRWNSHSFLFLTINEDWRK